MIVSVINDLATDQRVHKVCCTLEKLGYEVLLVGRKQRLSLEIDSRSYTTRRMKLLFEKGPLFYLGFHLRLFFFLLLRKPDLLVANDLDTLLPNFIVSKLKGIPLVYDTHEIFTEVPELQKAPYKKKVWQGIEQFLFPRLENVFTVNDSIAAWYGRKYNVQLKVVRNIPVLVSGLSLKSRHDLDLPNDKAIIVLQGSGINVQRGGEEMVLAMNYIGNVLLLIIGAGDCVPVLKDIVEKEKLSEKVRFVEKMPYGKMMQYTRNADIGLTLDKDSNLNYLYSLPNKLFDYIHAGTAILASRLPEIEKIITRYDVGDFIDHHDPRHIADKINEMLSDRKQLIRWKENTQLAARELTWETEEKELVEVYKKFLL